MAKIFPRFKDGDNLEPRHINWIFSELERWRHASATPPLVFADTDGDDPPTIEFWGQLIQVQRADRLAHLGAADYNRFAQERVLSNEAPEKDTAKNTKEAVSELKDIGSGIKELVRKFTTAATLRGPS